MKHDLVWVPCAASPPVCRQRSFVGLVREREHLAAATRAAHLHQLVDEGRGDSHAPELGIDSELIEKRLRLELVGMQELNRTDKSSRSAFDVRQKEVVAIIGQKRANCRRVHLMVKEVSRFEYSAFGPRLHDFHPGRSGTITHEKKRKSDGTEVSAGLSNTDR
jgi:hypothetical protein